MMIQGQKFNNQQFSFISEGFPEHYSHSQCVILQDFLSYLLAEAKQDVSEEKLLEYTDTMVIICLHFD